MGLSSPEKKTIDNNANPVPTTFKTYRRRTRGTTIPDELVLEMLLHLPARTLARFKSVCKAWHAIIANPSFIQTHLQQSSSKHEQELSFLITPHIVNEMVENEPWPSTFSNNVPFYLWQKGQDSASLIHTIDFHGEFGSVYTMSHCNGLIMLPTDTKLYVFNPATSDVLKLPDAQKDFGDFQSVGFGLDLCTNTYKVARFFYRKICFSKGTYNAGMEVYTIGCNDSCWKEITEDPPFPLQPNTPKYFKGSLYWHIYKGLLKVPPQGFVRFSLEDEKFSFIPHPSLPSEGDQLDFVEIGGELCLAQYMTTEIVMWVSPSRDNHHWKRLHVIKLPDAWRFQPLGMFNGDIIVRKGNYLYYYDEVSQSARELVSVEQLRYKNPRLGSFHFKARDCFFFNIIPYMENLVPLKMMGDYGVCK